MSQLIISVSGLRGIIGETLTPEVAMRYALAFAAELREREHGTGSFSGSLVMTRDGRGSGAMLADAIHAALNAAGVATIDAGIAATPTTGVLIRSLRAAGGLQISASHNPPEYNGIKLFSAEGRVIPKEPGARVLEKYRRLEHRDATATKWMSYDALGTRRSCLPDAMNAHLDAVLRTVDVDAIRKCTFNVLLDSNRGAGSLLGERLLQELGCRFAILGARPDGRFEHVPEPTAENLGAVCAEARASGAAITFCQDPDADRLAVIDEQGRYLGEEYTVALCADHVLRTQCSPRHPLGRRRKKGPLVVNCASSRMSEDIAGRYGVPLFRSAVGEANVVDLMLETGAVFGGEGNGGPIDPAVGMVRDSFVGIATLLDAMCARGKSIAELAEELPSYAIVKRKMSLPFDRVAAALDAVESELGGGTVSRLDGLRIDFKDSWVLLRASNTEPVVRTIAEAATAAQADALCDRVEEIVALRQ